jgi:alpha-L-rhamnosidase
MSRLASFVLTMLLFASLTAGAPVAFQSAKPVWSKGREKEMNLTVGFRAAFGAPREAKVTIRLTASTLYRLYVNGTFAGYGPARGPHGWFRIDEWDVTPLLKDGANVAAIEVAGYNVNSYYVQDQPSFLQAEILANGKVLASTNGGGVKFTANVLAERVQKVQRYSFQRPFSEVYCLKTGWDAWRQEAGAGNVALQLQPARPTLARGVPYPRFQLLPARRQVAEGALEQGIAPAKLWRDRALTKIGPKLGGYKEEELETIPSIELQKIRSSKAVASKSLLDWSGELHMEKNAYRVVDFGTNFTGFLGATLQCATRTRVYLAFDEILSNGDVDFKRLGCVNVVTYDLDPGTYSVESFEPYTMRYMKILVTEGAADVSRVYLRDYANPQVYDAHFASSDARLNRLFAAGRETFRQNALDVFMDCPSRERAGWLCDSYFTARVAPLLSGDTAVERNFLENFLLPPGFAGLPKDMLPMCYPADHPDGVFIPNWSLWFVLQLEEYLERSGDRRMVDALQPKVMNLLEYFKQFHNQDGLLEKLKSWVFVEWSAANKFTQDVNYPSNMLYAAALDSAGRMYTKPGLRAQAASIRETIRRQSFDGEFFVDNAVRKNGRLEITRNRSEVCQYFAFYFGVATPETHAALWQKLQQSFGPDRKKTGAFKEIHAANSFVGNVLRLELLSRRGLGQQILDESVGYLLYMADRTGTLWENDGAYASCNHGFASHAVKVLYRDVLGLYNVDPAGKRIAVRIPSSELSWCEGRVPIAEGGVSLRWWKEGDDVVYHVDAPASYRITVENRTNRNLIER